jgi:hypothetical protein
VRQRISRPRRVRATAHSEEDIASHLLSAVSGGAGSTSKTLRKVFRQAVEGEYQAAQAVARVRALHSQAYSITAVDRRVGSANAASSSSASGALQQAVVKYEKGVGYRGEYEETVELIPEPLLSTLIRLPISNNNADSATSSSSSSSADNIDPSSAEYDREVLKPVNLAKASPRIFWSLVHKYGPDLTSAISNIISDLDPSAATWLRERKRELSEKAKENQRQLQLQQEMRASKRRKTAAGSSTSTSTTTTSTGSIGGGSTAAVSSGSDKYGNICSSVLNKLELVHVVDEEDQLSAIAAFLSDASTGANPVLALASLSATTTDTSTISASDLSALKSSAQRHIHAVLYAFMLFNSQKLKIALYKLRVRCVRELLLWRGAAQGLYDALLQIDCSIAQLRVDGGEGFAVSHVAHMLALGEHVDKTYPFLTSPASDMVSDDFVDDCKMFIEDIKSYSTTGHGDDGGALQEVWAEDWIVDDDSVSAYMKQRCRVFLHDAEDESSAGSVWTHIVAGSYWEDGEVVGYLPPTEEDPYALFRVHIDAYGTGRTSGSTTSIKTIRGRFEDLEEEEVKQAIGLRTECLALHVLS